MKINLENELSIGKNRILNPLECYFPREIGAIALSYPPIFIDDSGAEFHAD